jgi:threonine dehydrogenase-like Zn-dependent dehydrogenase
MMPTRSDLAINGSLNDVIEPALVHALQTHVRPEDTVVVGGGGVGVTATIAALLAKRGRVIWAVFSERPLKPVRHP